MKVLNYDVEEELDEILLEAAVHIKLSLEIKENIIEIFYPLYLLNVKK